ncbi:P-loop containing nucleoside triphosphate hydrolase protein [Trametopsis cervina]|nr:P-loop containing nucleoside triphosphate hydrolase protein [Trametopsis cervina]
MIRALLFCKPQVTACIPISHRLFSLSVVNRHENPLGLPRRTGPAPEIPRRSREPVQKRPIPNVKSVIAVASGKGGVGKSTVAVNLACQLSMRRSGKRPLRVGILDLDIFGPSLPGLMGLDTADTPLTTEVMPSAAGAIVPLRNHGLKCMSMGFLLPPLNMKEEDPDKAVAWRGLMVQKAVQQLLFDVDWRSPAEPNGEPLDVLIIDLPPGTGDVALTLGQLVRVDGAVIVSTPQNVALYDVRRGIAMFKQLSIPILGMILNQAYFTCSNCDKRHMIYGDTSHFYQTAQRLGIPVLGELPVIGHVNEQGNRGVPFILSDRQTNGAGIEAWQQVMDTVQDKIYCSHHI